MLSLSEATAQSTSVAAIGVAAHESDMRYKIIRTIAFIVFAAIVPVG